MKSNFNKLVESFLSNKTPAKHTVDQGEVRTINTIKKLKEQLRAVEADIDRIVLSGGHIGHGDPLTQEAQAIRTQINKLVRGI
jgi:hypothetical protein